ncbi:MAG: DUF4870 domain-containing protein [Anaerolineales bacterium]|nr:DUF4870 domain-containing protein [Anaerolineales bacterium]
MDVPESTLPSQDERIMGALPHISVLIPYIGIIVPIMIWVTQKDKSRFVYLQALQAAAYQFALFVATLLGWGCYILSFVLLIHTIALIQPSSEWPVLAVTFIPFCVLGLIGLGWLFFLIYGIVAAIQVFQGKDFRYIVIGDQVERFMQK